jgi:hypothetical protein
MLNIKDKRTALMIYKTEIYDNKFFLSLTSV